jgi:hypothetical protein
LTEPSRGAEIRRETVAVPSSSFAPPGFSRTAWVAAAAIALGAAIFAAATLHRTGVTIDEPALLYAGDRTLHALAHPRQPGVLDFRAGEPPGFHSHFPRLPEPQDPEHYPVLPALVASVADATVGRALGLGPVDGHHAGLGLLAVAALFLYTLYACRLLGDLAGVAAGLALACFPTAVAHTLNDPKDWPCAMFYALTVLAAGVGLVERRARHLWLAGLTLGLALSCKQNGVLAAVTVLLAAPFMLRRSPRPNPREGPSENPGARHLIAPLLLLPYLGAAIFLLAWPWLWWAGPSQAVARLGDVIGYARAASVSTRAGWSAHPFRCLLWLTPPVILLAAAAGAWPAAPGASPDRRTNREALAIRILLGIWLLLPLVRIARPHANFYDGNRHFIEYVPALCALAGLGVAELCRAARPIVAARFGAAGRRGVAVAAIAAGAIALVWPLRAYHPFELAYFNVLAGGLGGAQRDGLFRSASTPLANGTEGDYWSSSLREGMRAAAAAAPPGQAIGLCTWLPELADIDWDGDGRGPPPVVTTETGRADLAVIYVSPREKRCAWKKVHELERQRSVLERVERGGGLIYEILGPRSASEHPAVSPPTVYDP